MTNLCNPQHRHRRRQVGINQMYVEGKGFDIAPNATFWIGKRFYARADVHIVDTFFTNMSGVGAGVTASTWAAGKLGFCVLQERLRTRRRRHVEVRATASTLELTDIATNPGGKLRVTGTVTNGDFTGGKQGPAALSASQHSQDNSSGWAAATRCGCSTRRARPGWTATSATSAAPSAQDMRVVESLTWQRARSAARPSRCGSRTRTTRGSKYNVVSLGGRASLRA